jgi:flagellar biosynthesis/type III secretory pathway chaperone
MLKENSIKKLFTQQQNALEDAKIKSWELYNIEKKKKKIIMLFYGVIEIEKEKMT